MTTCVRNLLLGLIEKSQHVITFRYSLIDLGRDASRSFHTGGTSDADLTDDLTGLEDEALAGIHHWLTFYQKQYQQIGIDICS